jgi:hypothetical protein
MKASYSRVGFPSRQFFSCRGDAEPISISIFKEECAGSHTRPGARFDLYISSAPEEPTISVRNIRVSIGFVERLRL